MAKIKYSALVSDMRNKLNGSVMSKNRYGSYVRNKVTPVNPQTSFQQNARQILGNLSSSFRSLSRNAIIAWNNAAKNFPFTDIFGDVRHLTGQTLFVKLNANLEKINHPRILTPPQPTGFPQIAVSNLMADMNGSTLTSLKFDFIPALIPVNFQLAVYATDGISKSISFIKNHLRFLGTFQESGGVVDITDEYTARFGNPLPGSIIHLHVALISTLSGQQSVPVSTTGIAGTPVEFPEIQSLSFTRLTDTTGLLDINLASGEMFVPSGFGVVVHGSDGEITCAPVAPIGDNILTAMEPGQALDQIPVEIDSGDDGKVQRIWVTINTFDQEDNLQTVSQCVDYSA